MECDGLSYNRVVFHFQCNFYDSISQQNASFIIFYVYVYIGCCFFSSVGRTDPDQLVILHESSTFLRQL